MSNEGKRLLEIYRPCTFNDVRGQCVLHLPPEHQCENCKANLAASLRVLEAAKLRRRLSVN